MGPSTFFTTSLQVNNPPRSLETYQFCLKKDGRPVKFTLTPQPDSAAVLLYHRQKRQFLFVKHFRPAVHLSRVGQMPENRKKGVDYINWKQYEKVIGVRLCAGFVDYNYDSSTMMHSKRIIEETALAAVEGEFGYRLESHHLQHIESFLTGVAEFGARCHLYYAELDEVIKIREDSKNVQTIWLTVDEARQLLNSDAPLISSSDFYALVWWFKTKKCLLFTEAGKEALRGLLIFYGGFNYRQPKLSEVGLSKISPSKSRSYTMHVDIGGGLTKACDIPQLRCDTLAVLIKDIGDERNSFHKDWIDRLVLTKRFRPAAFFARTSALTDRMGNLNTSLDPSLFPCGLWYTLELASGKAEKDEDDRSAILRIAATQLGYRIPKEKLKFIRKLVIGSSHLGDSVHLYYAECGKKDQIEGWKNGKNEEGVMMMQYPCALARYMLEMQDVAQPLPPSVFIAFQSVFNDMK